MSKKLYVYVFLIIFNHGFVGELLGGDHELKDRVFDHVEGYRDTFCVHSIYGADKNTICWKSTVFSFDADVTRPFVPMVCIRLSCWYIA